VFTGLVVVNDYAAGSGATGMLYNCTRAVTASDLDAGNDVYIRSAQASAWKLPALQLTFAGDVQGCVALHVSYCEV
jgi:hypothetical protein